jgi:hypothetical protein
VTQQGVARHGQLVGDLGGDKVGVHRHAAVPVHEVLERFQEAVGHVGAALLTGTGGMRVKATRDSGMSQTRTKST